MQHICKKGYNGQQNCIVWNTTNIQPELRDDIGKKADLYKGSRNRQKILIV